MAKYQYLTDNGLTLQAVWAWAKRLVQDLNARDVRESAGAVPAGSQMFWLSSEAPLGWLVCDGGGYSAAEYPELFLFLGYTFGGAGDTFNLPDMRNRVLMGAGSLVGLGETAGSDTVTLTEDQLPEHTHAITDPGHTHDFAGTPHTHVVDDPTHTHTFAGTPHTHTINDPGHHHTGGVNFAVPDAYPQVSVGGGPANTGGAYTGIGIDNATAGGTNSAAAAGVTNELTTADGSNSLETTGIAVEPTGSGAGFSVLNPVFGINVIIKA